MTKRAFTDTIKEASIKLGYATDDIKNESDRQSFQKNIYFKLIEIFKDMNYKIVECSKQ